MSGPGLRSRAGPRPGPGPRVRCAPMASGVVLEPRPVTWECTLCGAQVTKRIVAAAGHGQAEMHPCPKLGGFVAPMSAQGVAVKVTAVERGDYEGGDAGLTQVNEDGRPIATIYVERDDGVDCFAYAPAARGSQDAGRVLARAKEQRA